MADERMARSVLGAISAKKDDEEPRQKYAKEWQRTARAYDLELRYVDGRCDEGISWAHYRRREFKDDGIIETLRLIFVHDVVCIKGHHLRELTERLKEERLEHVQEHDSGTQISRAAENEGLGPTERKYIAERITVEPAFDKVYELVKGALDDKPDDQDGY